MDIKTNAVIILLLMGGGCHTDVSLKTPNRATRDVQIHCVPEKTFSWDEFVDALMWVESRYDTNAFNESEDAVGCLQIRPIMLREVNRVLRKETYTLHDRWDKVKSVEMFEIISSQVNRGKCKSFIEFCEVVARRWNGGRRGDRKKATIRYWQRVEARMRK